jgi:PPP family 3-phenylpropionic acid transporter
LITGAFGFVQPFVPLYLDAAGIAKGQIGLLMGLATGAAAFLQPVLGRLSDRIDARRPVMIGAALVATAAYLSFRLAHSFGTFLVLLILGGSGFLYLNAVGGVLVGRIAAAGGGGAAYAGFRRWGSVGYVVVTLVTGFLLRDRAQMTRSALEPIFAWGPLLFLTVAGIATLIPDPKATWTGAAPVRKSPLSTNLITFFVAIFLYNFALYGASSFLSLHLKSMGASPLWITVMFAAGVVCEILVMSFIGRWTDRHGRWPALAFALVLMPIRLLLYVPATHPLWAVCVQLLHGLNFGIVGAVGVAFVNDLADERERGAAQARLALVASTANALGPIVCGTLVTRFGIPGMFVAMSVVGAAGAAVFLTRVRESHPDLQHKRPGAARRGV